MTALATQMLLHITEQSKHIGEQSRRIDSQARAIKWRDAKIESITFELARNDCCDLHATNTRQKLPC